MIIGGAVNRFRGLELDPGQLPEDVPTWIRILPAALREWRAAGLALVWLKVPIAQARLIPAAVARGFAFHHSQPDYLMLALALEPDAFIPPYATHYIGAGGVVIDAEDNLLVVSERFRRDRSRPYWKLPGGALHPGEHLAACAMREVWEETGIRTEFSHLAAFRHWHGYRFGQSDIYVVCRLQPLSRTITRCEREIEQCVWMPLAEFLASPDAGAFNRAIVRAALAEPRLARAELPRGMRPAQHEAFFARNLSR